MMIILLYVWDLCAAIQLTTFKPLYTIICRISAFTSSVQSIHYQDKVFGIIKVAMDGIRAIFSDPEKLVR